MRVCLRINSSRTRSQSEKEAQQNKLEESMRGSNWVQARKAAEDLERRRTLQAKRTERMELVREKRRLAVRAFVRVLRLGFYLPHSFLLVRWR